ncbi:MAG: diguanylate cyclase [Candidatus Gastranaerophilales bacterium]|nr:diguanylate cyclase [Candidatus Gastranaerophilales bacterium]
MNKLSKIIGYLALFFIAFMFIAIFLHNTNINDFLMSMENRTFDLRQNVLANSRYKKPNKDIILVTIDDHSYEYLLNKYGEWPISRDIYAKFINYVEQQKPAAIAFDLMFIKSIKSSNNADNVLANAIGKYKNVYVGMNFDNQPFDVRMPIELNKKFQVNVQNKSKVNFSDVTFTNCRSILPQILEITPNVGIINVYRSTDGILRKIPPLMIYQGEYYPHLALMVGLEYLKEKESRSDILARQQRVNNFVIERNSNIKLGRRSIPLDKDGGAILNWYGPEGQVFEEIPFYKVIQAMDDKDTKKFNFKNKIIYFGTTVTSLSDIKSTPVSKLYPGVEVHATYINNLIDNNFIKKVSITVDILISMVLAILVGFVVIRTSSTIVAVGTTIFSTIGYIVLTYFLMKFFNLWVGIILPITVVISVFVSAYIIKYILKSRDFEYQYKLATTDGLTDLYNHRYFQEQMIMQVENCKRYNSQFSLILIDIDFFKKFNDTFGHQSGDAVLRQVAQRLKKNVRTTDIVCRYGGEEMAVILPNTDRDEVIITAQKLCKVVSEKPCKLANEQESTVTISLGIATYPNDGQAPNEMIASADSRLYSAKENGRNQVGL